MSACIVLSKAAIRLLSEMLESSDISQSPEDAHEELERLFLFSVSWALGGLLEPDERSKFDHYLRQLCPNNMPSLGGVGVATTSDGDSVSGVLKHDTKARSDRVDVGVRTSPRRFAEGNLVPPRSALRYFTSCPSQTLRGELFLIKTHRNRTV